MLRNITKIQTGQDPHFARETIIVREAVVSCQLSVVSFEREVRVSGTDGQRRRWRLADNRPSRTLVGLMLRQHRAGPLVDGAPEFFLGEFLGCKSLCQQGLE